MKIRVPSSFVQNRGSLRIAIFYFLLGALWILFSDRAMAAFALDAETIIMISIYKGWGYVLVTAMLLYVLISRHTTRLNENREMYQLLADNVTDVIWVLDLETRRFRYVSPSVKQLRGYTSEEVISQDLESALSPESMRYLERLLSLRLAEFKKGIVKTYTDEIEQSCRDGTFIWTETATRFAINKRNGHVEVYGVSRDISERRQAESELRQWANAFEGCAHGIAIGDPDTNRVLACNPAFAALHKCRVEELIGSPILSLYAPSDHEVVRRYIQKADALGHARFEVTMIRKDGSTFPVQMDLVSVRGENGTILHRVLTAQDITERKQAEEALRERERHLILALSSARMSIWEWDPQTGKVAWSPEYFEFTALDHNELREKTGVFTDFLHHEDAGRVATSIEKALKGESIFAEEFRILRPDGGIRWLSSLGHPEYDSNRKIFKVIGTIQDITERKQAEEALKQAEAKYRNLVELLPVIVYTAELGANGKWTYVSPQIESLLGFSSEEWMADPGLWYRQIHPEDRERQMEVEQQAWQRGTSFDSEYRLLTKDGREIWVRDVGHILPAQNGNAPIVQGTLMDITKRKQVEKALSVSQQNYAALINSIDGIVWEADAQTFQFYFVSQQAERLLGYPVEQWTSEPTFWRDHIYPDDRTWVVEYCMASTRQKRSLDFEYRMIAADGRIVWLRDIVTVIVENDQPVRLRGVMVDITKYKQIEEALQDSERRYRALFDSTPVAIWEEDFSRVKQYVDALKEKGITDIGAYFRSNPAALKECMGAIRIRDVNDAAVRMYKAESRESLIRNSYEQPGKGEFKHNADDFAAIAEGRTSRTWEGEDETVSGEPIEISVTWSVVPGHEADYSRVIVTTIDVTERRRAERELRTSNERFNIISRAVNEAVWDWDLIANRIIWNDAVQTLFQYKPEEVDESPNWWIENLHPEDREAIVQSILSAIHSSAVYNWKAEYRYKKADGSYAFIFDRGYIIREANGKAIRMVGAMQDITERKQAEKEMARHLAEMEALYENGLAISRLFDPRAIAEKVIETIAPHLTWRYVTIHLRKENSNELELIAFNMQDSDDEKKREVERKFRENIKTTEDGISGWVAKIGIPIRSGNIHAHPRFLNIYPEMQSGLYVPLRVGDRFIGVISVESEQPDAFSDRDERLLATLANQMAVAIENARLYQSLQNELAERKRAEEELRQSREQYQDLFENSPVATWLEDFSAVVEWMDELRAKGVKNLREYLASNPEDLKHGISLIRILNANQAAVKMNGAQNKEELLENIRRLMIEAAPREVMIHEMDMIWQGHTSFEFEMTSHKLDGTLVTGIQHMFIPVQHGKPDYRRVIFTSTDITERVNAEKALQESEQHYRELADSITDIFFELDNNLCYTYWNKASAKIFGLAAEDVIGKAMFEVFGKSDEQMRIEKIYQDTLRNRRARIFHTSIPLNGQRHVFEVTAYPSTRGLSVIAKDVTERTRTEAILQKRFELMEFSAHHSLEEVMQKALDFVCELTGSAIGFFHLMETDQTTPGLSAWSPNAHQFFDLNRLTTQHLPVDQAGLWAEAVRLRRAIIHNDYKSRRDRKELPEGHANLVREMIIPIIRNERIVAVLGVGNKEEDYTAQDLETAERFADYAWDITERKQMEIALAEERNQLARRVEERTAELSRANANLARALRVKDEFLANVSHELRTPLNAILGLSESLAEQIAGPLNEKQLKYISTISESGHHLLSLINDILDLAKIEAGQVTLDINKVDVNAVCQASLRMIKQLAQKKNQEVTLDIEEGLGLMWADERRLKQMIVNLLSNAVKFTPENGKLGLEVRGDKDGNKVMITVWDTGIGISEEDMEKLFKPFVQLKSGLAREATGTGLGLALVAQMARLHGGSVSVTSQPGVGSRFTIVLPWEPALMPDAVERMKITGKFRAIKQQDAQKQPTILLIEDTKEVTMMITDYLEMNGFKVISAQDGADGLTQAKLSHPDLILMDIQMPRMNGIEATQKLRSEAEFKHTPIIALTALAMPGDRERCLAAGMDEYISKPVNLHALVKIIRDCLSRREERSDQ